MDHALSRWFPMTDQLRTIAMELIENGMEDAVAINDMPIGNGVDVRKSCEIGCKIISVALDGTVENEKIKVLEDLSYELTKKVRKGITTSSLFCQGLLDGSCFISFRRSAALRLP